MNDTLERERQLNNLIDEVRDLAERVRRLEEQVAAQDAATPAGARFQDVVTGLWYELVTRTISNDVNPGVTQLFLRRVRGATE